MSEQNKKEYIVLKPHTLNFEVGQTVKLTDEKAKNLANKVRLKDEVASRTKQDEEIFRLKEEAAKLQTEMEALRAENEGLKKPSASTSSTKKPTGAK